MGVGKGKARPRAKPIVYRAINLINGKQYIGITMFSLGTRRSQHIWDAFNLAPKGSLLHKAIRKYGSDNIKFSVISRHQTYEEAKAEEVRLIALLTPEYNQGRGGDGNAGWHHSETVVEQIRARMKENPINFWKGKKLPEHVVAQMVERQSQPEAREKWEQYRAMGPIKSRHPVVCLDDGMEFESISAAAKFYGLDSSSIAEVVKGSTNRRTAGGRVFRYAGADHGGSAEADAVRAATRKSRARGLEGHRRPRTRSVRCVSDNNREFPTIKAAAEYYDISRDRVQYTCQHGAVYMTDRLHVFEYTDER